MKHDHREFTRVAPHFSARIEVDGKTLGNVSTVDISMNGAMISSSLELEKGQHCKLIIQLGDKAGADIIANCMVTRNEPGKMALEFTGLELDSYLHLEKLVLFNADEPENIQHELDAHLGIKPG